MLARLVDFRVPPEQVILLELDNPECLPAFQPLHCDDTTTAEYQTDAFMRACAKCWGQESFDQTLQLRRWLGLALRPIIEAGATPAEFEAMLSLANHNQVRDGLVRNCTDKSTVDAWQTEFPLYRGPKQKMENAVGSTVNRLEPFYKEPYLRRLFGQTDPTKVINWRSVMDSGKIVLVKFTGGTTVPETAIDMIGTLLVNELVRAAKQPPDRASERAFYLVADEFQRVVSHDFMSLMRETGKFRLFAWLAHQDPSALRAYDEELYQATLTNARCKILFGGIDCAELAPLIRNAYAGVLDPDMVKFDLNRTYFEPQEETRTVYSRGEADSEGESEGDGQVDASSWSAGAVTPMDGSWFPSASAITSGDAGGQSASHMHGTSSSHTSSQSESVVPFYRQVERQELSSRQFRSLEEQLQDAVNNIHKLTNQHAAVFSPEALPRLTRVWDIPDSLSTTEQITVFRQAVFATAGCYSSSAEVDAAIAERQAKISKGAPVVIGDIAPPPHVTIADPLPAPALPAPQTFAALPPPTSKPATPTKPVVIPTRKGLQLSANDLEILAAVHDGGYLQTNFIAEQFYKSTSSANRRLKQLSDAEYLIGEKQRNDRGQAQPTIWRITKPGTDALILAEKIDEATARVPRKAKTDHAAHEADVNRLRLAFQRHASDAGATVSSCTSGPALEHKFVGPNGSSLAIRPDRFLKLTVNDATFPFFIEVDRGTKDLVSTTKKYDVWRQLYTYTLYDDAGVFDEKFGEPGTASNGSRFRVLITVPSAQRRNNMIEKMIAQTMAHGAPLSPIRAYSIFDQVEDSPYAPIWIREPELAVVLSLLAKHQSLDEALQSHDDVRAVISPELLKKANCPSDVGCRDALIEALITTNHLQRFSILNPTW